MGNSPGNLVITPNGKTIYTANYSSRSVTPIKVATNTALRSIPLTNRPVALAVSPNGRTVYVCVYITGVVPINVATNTALRAIAVGDPTTIAITPNGKTAYVPHPLERTVTPVNLATGKVMPAITTGYGPVAIAITH